MHDPVYENFIHNCRDEALALSRESDVVTIQPLDDSNARYLAVFACPTLVRGEQGEVRVQEGAVVGLYFPPDYLRRVNVGEVVTFIGPPNAFHPQIRPPFICLGNLYPGMPLAELVNQIYAVLICEKVTAREDDCLSPDTCGWMRDHRAQLPLTDRPLRARRHRMTSEPILVKEL